MKLEENFSLHEFKCHDGTVVPEKYMDNVKKLAKNLQIIRDYFNKPINIMSGYRHTEYNKRIGGAKNSQHRYAKAADIKISGIAPKEVYKAIEILIKDGVLKNGGIGLYSTFVHYDVRDKAARW